MSKQRKRNDENAEIFIPIGYGIEDFLDTDDSDFDEPPIMVKEVKVRYEQQDGTRADDG